MKIAGSSVSMASSRAFESHVSEQRISLEVTANRGGEVVSGAAAIYERSGGSMVEALDEYHMQASQPEEQQTERARTAPRFARANQSPRGGLSGFRISDKYEMKIQLLHRLIEILYGGRRSGPFAVERLRNDGPFMDLRGPASRAAGEMSRRFSAGGEKALPSVGTTAAGTLWQRVTASSGTRSESEYTAFQSQGYAVTEDGRSIRFNVEFSLSRSFTASYDSLTSESFVMTDPLIINLEDHAASVSDEKFQFDLDSDGQTEEISFAGAGSGFLALDRNGNGVIDDGSELFGTKSGDGFADLAAYDEDGNHWIDENDSVYAQLRVWTKDADGSDRLMGLKEANVGAIYLGSAETEFSLNDAETNETNAVIRRTGIYLRETGEAGTLSHVDLRC